MCVLFNWIATVPMRRWLAAFSRHAKTPSFPPAPPSLSAAKVFMFVSKCQQLNG